MSSQVIGQAFDEVTLNKLHVYKSPILSFFTYQFYHKERVSHTTIYATEMYHASANMTLATIVTESYIIRIIVIIIINYMIKYDKLIVKKMFHLF